MRLRIIVALTAALLAVPAPAFAKGASEATIEGKGLAAPIQIRGSEGEESPLWKLADQTGIYFAVFEQSPDQMIDKAPSADLGPELTIRWVFPGPSGQEDTIVQDLYPYAAEGPVTYVEPGQPFWDAEKTHGGWYRAANNLVATLSELGVPLRKALEAPPTEEQVTTVPTTTTSIQLTSSATEAPGAVPWPLLVAAGTLGLVLATTGAAVARRRRSAR